MKRRTAGILLGLTLFGTVFAGCGGNAATEAATASAETEQEGRGETAEAEDAEKASDEAGTEEEAAAEEPEVSETVLILLPEDETEPWKSDGEVMTGVLEEAGYQVCVLSAEGEASEQVLQIRQMADETAAAIIAPVDPFGLEEVLDEIREKDIPVFSYDRLIMNTDTVNYYTAFDQRKTGQMLGEYIAEKLDLKKAQEAHQPCSIEFLMGSLDDTGALFLYNGLMEVLQEYMEDGTLVCPSQRVSFEDTGILRWSGKKAETVMQKILEQFYQDGTVPDVICTGFDEAAFGAQEALKNAGIFPANEKWPMILGAGCGEEAVKAIEEGSLSCGVYMDRRVLAESCADMVTTYLAGEEKPEVNDYEQYDNGKKIIPAYVCEAKLIDADNYKELIDNGYYTPQVTPTEGVSPAPAEEEETSEP